MTKRSRTLAPISDGTPRRNSKRMLIIDRDGAVTERTLLQVPDASLREEIICRHYLRHYVRCFSNEPVGVNELSRDAPWDFEVQLSSGERFFIEITAIADNKHGFEMGTREERLLQAAREPTIRLRDLHKLAYFFPNSPWVAFVGETAFQSPDEVVPNPLANQDTNLFVGLVVPPAIPLADQIREAVNRKVSKPHAGKERAVLVVDYRGNFADGSDLIAALDTLDDTLEACPFREVWFYVGYFSDDDGNNAEFSFTPLKLPESMATKLAEFAAEVGIDAAGRAIW